MACDIGGLIGDLIGGLEMEVSTARKKLSSVDPAKAPLLYCQLIFQWSPAGQLKGLKVSKQVRLPMLTAPVSRALRSYAGLFIPLVAAAALALVPWPAQAQSMPPHIIFGTALVDGVAAAPGTEIAAFDGDRKIAVTYTGEGGLFRLDINRLQGAATFTVGGLPAAEKAPDWISGGRTRSFKLTATSQAQTCLTAGGQSGGGQSGGADSTPIVHSHELPQIFIGTASIAGQVAAVNTEVTAWDGAAKVGVAYTREGGVFSIQVARSHGPISFRVNGLPASRTHSPWVAGGIISRFDLNASNSAACLLGTVPVDALVASLADRIVRIFTFDNAEKRWLFYDPVVAEYSDLTHMNPGTPYYILVSESFEADLNGSGRKLTCTNGNCWNVLVW